MISEGWTEVELGELPPGAYRSCLAYWQDLRRDRDLPRWSDFDFIANPPDLVPYYTVLDVKRDPDDFIYRFWGTGHVEVEGFEMTGKSIQDFPSATEAGDMDKILTSICQLKRPVAALHRYRKDVYRPVFPVLFLRLPFSEDGKDVSHILNFSDYREDTQALRNLFGDQA